jgi:acylphosphatase
MESGIAGKGLGFDYLSRIKDQALKLGLVGTVFVKEDGSIKVIAEGIDVDLEKFAKTLEPSRFFSTVENFYILWKESDIKYKDFSIA